MFRQYRRSEQLGRNDEDVGDEYAYDNTTYLHAAMRGVAYLRHLCNLVSLGIAVNAARQPANIAMCALIYDE